MSSPLAIAAVTAVLKSLLDHAATRVADDTTSFGNINVTAKAPDHVPNDETAARMNLFMYRVVPNQGWNNTRLPSNNDRGERLTYPPLALDLFYLLSVYDKDNYEAEILLGYAMQIIHETPVLTRQKILDLLNPPAGTDSPLPNVKNATASDLANQVELIKISILPLSMDELTKLWTAFQTNFRPSVAYHVSVVLIESKKPARSPLPVLTRGEPDPVTGRDQGVVVQANMLSPYPSLPSLPSLNEVLLPNHQPAIRLSTAMDPQILTLRGYHLDGAPVTARFTHIRTARILDLPAQPGNTESEFQVKMPEVPPPPPLPTPQPLPPPAPENPDSWLSGFYTLAAVVKRPGEPEPCVTNELPIVLAPRMTPITATLAAGTITFTVTCSPKVRKSQFTKLIVNNYEIAADPIADVAGDTDPSTDTLTFKAQVGAVPADSQPWLRLNVDSAESLLVDRSDLTHPTFDKSQQVIIR